MSAISDPNRVQNVWQLDGTSSPRFIKQALRLQLAPTINIEYEDSSFGTDAAAPLSESEADAPTGEAASSVDILDSMLGSDASEDERAQDSVAEQLERTLQCALASMLVCCTHYTEHARPADPSMVL